MKRILLTLGLMFSATCAQAYGVNIAQPILIGPLAGAVHAEFTQMLAQSGAVQCEPSLFSGCTTVHFVAVTGKRGRSRYIVATVTYVHYYTDTNQLRFTTTEVVRHTNALRRSKGAWFTPEEWGIDRLGINW